MYVCCEVNQNNELKTMYWQNHCNHSNFIGSIDCFNDSFEAESYDVYLHGQNDVCLRYGNEPHEYISTTLERIHSVDENLEPQKSVRELLKRMRPFEN